MRWHAKDLDGPAKAPPNQRSDSASDAYKVVGDLGRTAVSFGLEDEAEGECLPEVKI